MQTKDASVSRESIRGFSLLEMTLVVALVIVLASITFISLEPVLKQQRVTNAYNTTLAALRQAREASISQRTSYVVTFDTSKVPHLITVVPTFTGFQGVTAARTYSLPTDVNFDAESGIPTNNQYTPDRFGSGKVAIDFGYNGQGGGAGGLTTIYFCPDGSAQDAAGGNGQCMGNWNSGVIYIARPGDLMSSRAITVWGGTGRIRGWRLYGAGAGGVQWQRQ